MLEIKNLKIRINKEDCYDELFFINYLTKYLNKKYSFNPTNIKLTNLSLDARTKELYYLVSAIFKLKNERIKLPKNIFHYHENEDYLYLKNLKKDDIDKKIIICGMGPAGMFNALILRKAGFDVTIIEQGKKVEDRTRDIELLNEKGILNPTSNIQFGEGGAGTFSDGKLTTGINSPYIKYILETFHLFGAHSNITYDAMPHIGSDTLKEVIKNFRMKLIDMGVKIYFETKLINIKDHIVITNNEEYNNLYFDELVLATGHSAIYIYHLLDQLKIEMSPKNFSVGVRIEHLEKDISNNQYHGDYPNLPAAPYKLVTHLNERSLYSFCMCPGGFVVNSTSDKARLVTNGMSNQKRDNINSNSALLVGINVEDYYHGSIFDGIKFQQEIEEKAFNKEYPYYYPIQTVGSLLYDLPNQINKIKPTIKPGYYYGKVDDVFPKYVVDTLKEGLINIQKKMDVFKESDAVMTFPETRSSSTIRIERTNNLSTSIANIYAAGEGSGYAGGITSSAVDGIKIALKIMEKYEVK